MNCLLLLKIYTVIIFLEINISTTVLANVAVVWIRPYYSYFCFRFKTFYDETMPVIKHFEKKDLVMSVNAIPEPDEVSVLASV